MKRITAFVIITMLILSIAACSGQGTETAAETTAMPAASPSPSPAQSAAPTPVLLPDTDIPDVQFDISGYASGWNQICEGDKYIYYTDENNSSELYRIDKANKETAIILNNIWGWTLYSGIIYYAVTNTGHDSEGNETSAIKAYDPQTGKAKDIYITNNLMYNITVYNGLIYFIKNTADLLQNGIWSVKTDGKGAKRITKSEGTVIDSFCIYKDTIYYITGEPMMIDENCILNKCSLDGSGNEDIPSGEALSYFQIYNGKLSFFEPPAILDLSTGAEIPVEVPDRYRHYTLWGQYIIYINRGGGGFEYAPKLYAYDYITGKTYYLNDLEGTGEVALIPAFSESAFVRMHGDDGTHLSRIIIEDGKASLSEVMYIPRGQSPPSLAEDETAAPTPMAAPAPTGTPAPTRNKTVIIASSGGEIIGGYSKGKWLSQSEAAKLCKGKTTFNRYDLEGFMGTVKSSGVTRDEDDEYPGETSPDTSGCFYLNLPEVVDDGYSSYLYSGGKLPDIEIIEDTSELSFSLQNLVDNELGVQNLLDIGLGEGEAEVSIGNAVSADIDNDGEKETVVDARIAMDISLLCIIESDGTVKTIDNDDPISPYCYGDIYLQNIIDIDGDNISELVIDYGYGDAEETWVFKYDGRNVKKVLDYYVFYPCP